MVVNKINMSAKKKLLYIDFNLKDNAGHHAAHFCTFKRSIEKRNVEVIALGRSDSDPNVQGLLEFSPVLSPDPWNHGKMGNPRFLEIFDHANTIVEEISRIKNINKFDGVYFASVNYRIILSILIFIQKFENPFGAVPVFLEFAHAPDASMPKGSYGFESALIGLSMAQMKSTKVNVSFLANDPTLAADFRGLTQFEVTECAMIREYSEDRLPSKSGRLTVGFLGYQASHKGYSVIPTLIEAGIRDFKNVDYLVHQSCNFYPETDRMIEALELSNPGRVRFVNAAISFDEYNGLWRELNICCLPYSPGFYARAPSGIAQEAIINGCLIVGPNNTTVSTTSKRYNAPMCGFDDWNPQAIYAALASAIVNVDSLIGQIEEARRKVIKDIDENSVSNFIVSKLLIS